MVTENQSSAKLEKNSSVIISGGSGLIGKHLTSLLLSEGYQVSHLSRYQSHTVGVTTYYWDPDKKILDPSIFKDTEYLIHLAGANIGEKLWTKRRKEVIVESRVNSARLLHKIVSSHNIPLKAFISASAAGYYGSVISDKIFTENDAPGDDFLGTTCRSWEGAADLFGNSGIRTIKIRTGVVLEKTDSALSKLMLPSRFGFLVRLGDGKQYMPWIHITDLCRIYLRSIENPAMSGAYNAVATRHTTHAEFMNVLGSVLKKPVLSPAIPGFLIRTMLGEMSDVILKGSRISSEKLLKTGFSFLFNDLEQALNNVING